MKNKIQLYSYYRSSCSYRVRIALYLKNIPFEYIPIHLLRKGGEQKSEKYKQINPEGQVPTLIHNNQVITQSMAILHYLEDIYPSPALFPKEPKQKAHILSICETINSSTQPLQNLIVLNYLKSHWQVDENKKTAWLKFWIYRGLLSVEQKIKENNFSSFAAGRSLTAAELFIIPQIYNAKRFNVSLNKFPRLLAIEDLCQHLPAFKKAHPDTQPDNPLNIKKK